MVGATGRRELRVHDAFLPGDRLAPRGRGGGASGSAPTFGAVAEAFLKSVIAVRGVKQTTQENYSVFVRQHLLPAWGGVPIGDISPARIEGFIAGKRAPGGSTRFPARGLSALSLRVGLTTLGMILDRAVRDGHLPRNPLTLLGPVLPRVDTAADPFTTAEVQAILSAAETIDSNFATMLRLWVQCGARAGEVAGIQWGNLDLVRGRVTIKRTYTRGRCTSPKTARERTVSLLHPITEATREWRPGVTVVSRAVLLGLRRLTVQGIVPEAFVFGGSIAAKGLVERRWRRALAQAQVRYRPAETLRHTCASTLLSRGAPVVYVQRVGGWRSAGVLLRTYTAWLPEEGFDGAVENSAEVVAAPQRHPVPALRVVAARSGRVTD